jgi:hypothetical protein
MKRVPFFLLSMVFILPVSLGLAQESLAPPQHPLHAPDGGTLEMISSIFIPSMPNAPFTATVNTEWIRPLPDGSTITLKNHRTIARDAAGRVFQERRMFVPEDGKDEPTVRQIEISDPVAHEFYVCKTQERVCRLQPFSRAEFASFVGPGSGRGQGGSAGSEDLGKQSVGGLETVGTLETTVIPSGTMGNNSPLLSKREFWYSPLLGINLITKRQDPRGGDQNFEVSDIAVGEPDSKLFQVPAGFKVLDMRKPPEVSSPQSQATSSN